MQGHLWQSTKRLHAHSSRRSADFLNKSCTHNNEALYRFSIKQLKFKLRIIINKSKPTKKSHFKKKTTPYVKLKNAETKTFLTQLE